MNAKMKKMQAAAAKRKAAMTPMAKEIHYVLHSAVVDEVLANANFYKTETDFGPLTSNDIYIKDDPLETFPRGAFTGSRDYDVSIRSRIVNVVGDTVPEDVAYTDPEEYYTLGGFGNTLSEFEEAGVPHLALINHKYLPFKKFTVSIPDILSEGSVEVPYDNIHERLGETPFSVISSIAIDGRNLELTLLNVTSDRKFFAVIPVPIKCRILDDYTIEYAASSNIQTAAIGLHGIINRIEYETLSDENGNVDSLRSKYAFVYKAFQEIFPEPNGKHSLKCKKQSNFSKVDHRLTRVMKNAIIGLTDLETAKRNELTLSYYTQWLTNNTKFIWSVLTTFAFLFFREVRCIKKPEAAQQKTVTVTTKVDRPVEITRFELRDQRCVQYIYANNRKVPTGRRMPAHERKAHLRNYKSGKQVIVRACSINGGVPKNTIIVK